MLGIFIITLLYLAASDIIGINFGALWNAVAGWLGGAGAAASWLVGLSALIPFIGSFAVGFFLGFKLGQRFVATFPANYLGESEKLTEARFQLNDFVS